MVVHTSGVQTVARCARYGVVNREAHVVEEVVTEGYLAQVYILHRDDRAHRLSSTVTCQAVVVVCRAVVTGPRCHDICLSISALATPMHKEVFCLGHTLIRNHLLNLGNIHRVRHSTILESLYKRCDVIGAVSLLDILCNKVASNRQLCIER